MSTRKPSYKLVIVESPAKARTISKFLGRTYKVEASQGHVRDLPKSQLGVDVDNGFEPKYITIRGRGEVLEKIRKEAKGAKSVILATDPDREGEAISWHLAHILGIDPESACRVEFNEITEKTVKSAVKTPRQINMELVDAQQARRRAGRSLKGLARRRRPCGRRLARASAILTNCASARASLRRSWARC